MMKKRKVVKVLAMMLVIVMVAAFAAGCKKSENNPGESTAAATNQTSDTTTTTGTTPEGTTTTDTAQPTVTEAATPGTTAAATVTAAAAATTTVATVTKAATATQKATPTTKAAQTTATPKANPGQVKSMKFKSVADCYVIKKKPTENYPDEPTMNLFTGDFHRELFYKFDVKGVPGKVVGAKLMLYCVENNGVPTKDAGVWGIPATWNETEITFEKKPTGTLITNFTVPKDINVWITNDVSSYVKGNGQYAFNLISNESVRITLTAREYDKADLQPYLEVMYQ